MESAWAAGFFDGEGSSFLHRCTPNGRGRPEGYTTLTVSVSQKDRMCLDRLAAAVGGKVYGPYASRPRCPYQWQTTGEKAHRALNVMWPWLSEPKRLQARAAGFEPY